MRWYTVRSVLLTVGTVIAAYLTLLHYVEGVPLYCPGGGIVNCGEVLTSPESVWGGVPVPLWGVLWFLTGLVLYHWRRFPPRWKGLAAWIWSVIGLAAVLTLVYDEFWVLHAICLWCSALHAIILTLFVGQVIVAGADEPDDAESGS